LINIKHCSPNFFSVSVGGHGLSPLQVGNFFPAHPGYALAHTSLIIDLTTPRSAVPTKTKVLRRSQKYSRLKEMGMNQDMKPFLQLSDSLRLLNAEMNCNTS
jgi:hypothetical protein